MTLIGDLHRDTAIYRIFSKTFFFELFQERKNALVQPRKWHDPFENVFLLAEVRNAGGERGKFSFHQDIYGQCWTLTTASDAMWQIYSNKGDGVRVRTTVGRLIDSLCAQHGNWAAATCFVGKVEYLSDSKLRGLGQTIFRSGISSESIARSLLFKRKAFKHEREVRLLYIERGNEQYFDGVYKYDFNPLDVVNQAMVDGRLSYQDFEQFKNEVSRRTGLKRHRIKRSLLYTPPKGFVIEIP